MEHDNDGNVPDMPCTSEPSELAVNKWARAHGADYTYVDV